MGSLMGDPSKLYPKLRELHVETGKLGNTELSAWYDTFNQTTLNFLEWFQHNIGADNCLTFSGTLAHQELVSKNLFLEGNEYENALQEYDSQYPGIFDVKTNEFDCEFLEADLAYYQQELEYLQKPLSAINETNKHVKKSKTEKSSELTSLEFQRDEAASTCLQLAQVFDELNSKLGEKLTTCFNIIGNSDDEFSTTFLCNAEFKEEEEVFANHLEIMLRDINKLESENVENFYNSGSSLNSLNSSNQSEGSLMGCETIGCGGDLEKSVYNNPVYNKSSGVISERLIQAFYQHNQVASKVEVLNAKLRMVQNLNRFRVFPGKLRQNSGSKAGILARRQDEWESSVKQFVKCFINQPNMSLRVQEEAGIIAKLKCCTDVETKLDQLLQYQQLTLQLFSTEMETFESVSNFVKDVKEYVADDLQQCEERIEGMKLINSDYKSYCEKPFEEKWHLLAKILETIGSRSNLNVTDALQAVKSFEDKCDALQRKLFIEDVDLMAEELQKVEKNNNVLISFLSNKATDKLTVIPNRVYDALRHAESSITEESKMIKYYQGLPKEVNRKLEANKWLKLKRQLWMYFLKKPEKMEQILEEIERFVRNKRAAFLTS